MSKVHLILMVSSSFIPYRLKESRQPRVPMTICDKTFDLVVNHLTAVNYEGPVALSCDDSKLFGSLRLYWNGEEEKHYLVGAVGGPILVPNPDDIKALMSDPKLVKATEVSLLFSMSIC